ncbi:MAG: NACHT domain-containing protein, partial [Chloroflexota bacterium]
MGRYLSHVISRNRYLQLQGIRSGGKLVNIELESIFITLRATRTRTVETEDHWLDDERKLAHGEKRAPQTETVVVKVQEALADNLRMVVLGAPGSGKTTLMRYLALLYSRDCAEGSTSVRDVLGLSENGHTPILLPLRGLGAYLKTHYPQDDGTEGHARLLDYLQEYLKNERIKVDENFFDTLLNSGRVVMLLDGLDEVGSEDLRRRVARIVDSFAAAYSQCRIVVTSRIVGYSGAARLGENFATTTVRDFTLADIQQFLTHWHRMVSIGQMGVGESAEKYATDQTEQLLTAIQKNSRVRDLALNPLMLTVIALVHRDRVKLPDRRAELYAEAVDVLLGKWDEARGVQESPILNDRPFDIINRRLMLREIALKMQEKGLREIEADDLNQQLRAAFTPLTKTKAESVSAAERFLTVIRERTGLLVEAGQGVYRFSHLTFQEYLAAVEIAERDDYIAYTLSHVADPTWREPTLLEAGYLSLNSR